MNTVCNKQTIAYYRSSFFLIIAGTTDLWKKTRIRTCKVYFKLEMQSSLPKNKTGIGGNRVVFCQNYEQHHFRFLLYFRWMSVIGNHP